MQSASSRCRDAAGELQEAALTDDKERGTDPSVRNPTARQRQWKEAHQLKGGPPALLEYYKDGGDSGEG